MNSMRLMGQEVLPAMREIAKELGIVDPFEREPGSRAHTAGPSAIRWSTSSAQAGAATRRIDTRIATEENKWNLA